MAVFLDIQSAYDNVLSDILIEELISLGIPCNLISFINNLISFRKVHFKFDEVDEIRSVFRGLPQGNVLNPLYTRNIEQTIVQPVKILQYADDVAIYTSDFRVPIILHRLEDALINICSFLEERGLVLSANKTKLCVLTLPHVQTMLIGIQPNWSGCH